MKKIKFAYWFSIGFSIVLTVALMVYFSLISFVFDVDKLITLVVALSYALVAVIMVFFISYFAKQMKQISDRREVNKREFNVDSDFNNRLSFAHSIQKRAEAVSLSKAMIEKAQENDLALQIKKQAEKKNIDVDSLRRQIIEKAKERNKGKRGLNGAIITASVFSDSEKYQYYQLEQIKKFYGVIIKYFDTLSNMKENKGKIFVGYEFHVFFIYYSYADDDELKGFVNKIESDLYTLFGETKVSVNMHPAFGIYQIDGKTKDVYQMIEKSRISLRVASNSYQVFVYYDDSLTDESMHNDQLEKEIRRGIEKQEFKIYYQPKFDLSTSRFVGAEALIRWQHPEKGLFSPSAFIGESEKSGLIHILDFYVFDQVCKDLGDWKKRGRRMLPVSVNFSSYDFYRPDFVESVINTIETNLIAPNFIEVEVTESSTAANYFYVMSVLKRLKDYGINILMDDFGTGFSSLGNLKKYPISALKIDKSFIDEMQADVKSKEIVATIINLARSLGIQSIAEGVQTQAQVDILKEMKCNQIQGYFYSKPITKKDFEIFLSTNEFEKKGMLL
jgi:EAL domain-containing protein (putative c-di-GMP-specific phosphodiesterase class I)